MPDCNETGANASASASPGPQRYFGKYRGQVTGNVEEDPLMRTLHRIKVSVPQVPSVDDSWALPCYPYAGEGVGFYTVPPVGASVWVEFEGGNPNYPIWTGCFWDEAEFIKPSEENILDPAMVKMIITENTELILDDTEALGKIVLAVSDPAVEVPVKLEFNSLGAKIETGLSSLSMTPEGIITLKAGDSVITLSEEGINMTGPAITGEAEADISMEAGGAMELEAGGDASLTAGGAVEVNGGGDVEIAAGGAVEVNGGGDVEIAAGGAVEVNGGLDVEIAAGGAVEINGGGDVEIAALGAMQLNAIGDIEIASITMVVTAIMDINGLVEVTGDLLVDGQQVMFI